MMTRVEAQDIARGVRNALPRAMRENLKAIHVMPKLHSGHLTVRVYMFAQIAEDPDPFIFPVEEL